MLETLWSWIQVNQALAATLVAGSVLMLVLTAILLPVAIRLLPSDYFLARQRERQPPGRFPAHLYAAYLIAKNLLGVVFLIAGLAMLVLPGQGLLTILVALILLDFPGKYRLERRVVRYPWVIRSINWLRRRWGVPPLRVPPDPDRSS